MTARSAAEMLVVTFRRPSMETVKAVGELGIVAIDHQRQRQLLCSDPGQGQADEATTVARRS